MIPKVLKYIGADVSLAQISCGVNYRIFGANGYRPRMIPSHYYKIFKYMFLDLMLTFLI